MASASNGTIGHGDDHAALELIDLEKRFGQVHALDGVSFSVAAGEVSGFVGPNGAGKTTAMRIVLGILEPDAGDVRWHGRPIDEDARRRIGYMPEERGLYPKMRVAEQLVYFGRLRGLDAATAARNARRWVERLGLADREEDPVEELSQGNQQRVQLGVALVHEPEVLVLDEPFAGLDPVGVDVLAAALKDEVRERGIPVVFSSHQLELVERLCDSVTILGKGEVIASGGVEELRRQRAGRRFQVQLEGGDGDWVEGVPGARRVDDAFVELADGADPQALLDAARAAGPVRRFGPVEPSLADLFRDVVSAREPA
jgi:ABC-2 type transport system ATP-binding protein